MSGEFFVDWRLLIHYLRRLRGVACGVICGDAVYRAALRVFDNRRSVLVVFASCEELAVGAYSVICYAEVVGRCLPAEHGVPVSVNREAEISRRSRRFALEHMTVL